MRQCLYVVTGLDRAGFRGGWLEGEGATVSGRSPASIPSATTRPPLSKFAGFASVAILASVGIGLGNLVVTLVAMQVIDRVGRRPSLLSSLEGMANSLFVLAVAFALPQSSGSLRTPFVLSAAISIGAWVLAH